MPETIEIHELMSKIRNLDKEDQITLLERLVAIVRKDDDLEKVPKLSSISGVGSFIWKETNIDNYIDQERQW